jgi:HAD superfamily phosphatase
MAKLNPEILVFDVDGVLVDVQESYHRTILETVRRFTGHRVPRSGIQRWKNRPGYNDDWKVTARWIRSLGRRPRRVEVIRVFQQLYLGQDFNGYIKRERWLFDRVRLRWMARQAELSLLTGRPRKEIFYTLNKFRVRPYFRHVVALEDLKRSKPDPEGLRRILDGRDPATALYLGDSVDDALAAKRGGVAFMGVLPRGSRARRLRAPNLRRLGALTVLGSVNELEKWLR